jgi:hypothetical protein
VHHRLHPVFADEFLAGLQELEPCHPLNDASLWVRLDIALDPQGNVTEVRVREPSGVAAFDAGAVDALVRAQPFVPRRR